MRSWDFQNYANKYSTVIEITAGISGIAFLIYLFRGMLFLGETTFPHDHMYWGLPVFQFFAENLINGNLPLWDPFTHSGEPFYPIFIHLRLLEPITLLTIYLGHFFTGDSVTLYNWAHFMQNFVMVLGIYCFFRSLAKNILIRISLVPILLYSSFMLGPFRQAGLIYQFVWVPFIMYFLLRIIHYKDYRWHNWFVLAGLIGVNWQSYYFSGTWTFLFFFMMGLIFFRRDLLSELIQSPGFKSKLVVALAIIVVMMAPNISLMLEQDNFVYPARMVTTVNSKMFPFGGASQFEGSTSNKASAINMSYNLITRSGTFSQIWDYIQIISPDGNTHIKYPGKNIWGKPSEAYIYFGIMPWFIAVLGMIAGRHDLKKVWMLVAIGTGLVILGPAGELHRILYYLYPPLRFVRHTHALVLFLMFCFLYFYVLGCNHIYYTWRMPLFGVTAKKENKILLGNIIADEMLRSFTIYAVFLGCILLSARHIALHYESGLRYEFPYIILIAISVWALHRCMGNKGLYSGILAGHIGSVLIFTTNPIYFVTYIILAFAIPAGLFIFTKRSVFLSKKSKYYMTAAVIFVSLFILCGDLIYNLLQSKFLYDTEKHPAHTMNIDTTLHQPVLPQERLISPEENTATETFQTMRYLSLVYRLPYVFSSLMTHPESNGLGMLPEEIARLDHNSFEYALKAIKWNSFIMPRWNYWLTHSEISPPVLEKMFAVGKPMFQFKKGALTVDDNQLPAFLNQLGDSKSLQLLDEYVFLEREIGHSPDGLIAPNIKYEKAAQSSSDINTHRAFSYTIHNYEYSSFDMKVNTDETGILYWADGYDKWWLAYLNGHEVPIYRANVNFKAIVLPEGDSNIKFIYNPVWFKISLFIFYIAFITSMLAALSIFIYQRYMSRNAA